MDKKLLKKTKKSARLVYDAVNIFLPLIDDSLSIVDRIVNLYDTAQYNRKSCVILIDRVENARAGVKSLSRRKEENEENFRKKDYHLAFVKFIDILNRIESFVKEVGSLSGFRNFVQAIQIKEKFQILIEDFDSVVGTLNLAMVISNEEQRKKDVQTLEDDIAEMFKYLKNIEGGVTNTETGVNIVLEEVKILNKKVDKLTEASVVSKEFTPIEIPPIELEEPEQKHTKNGNFYKRWSIEKLFNVYCKKIITADTLEHKKIKAHLAILGSKIQQSSNIIKFYGLSTVNSERVMVFEWAEYGNLKEVYEEYEIDWPRKLQIVVDICRGIAFLHGCSILHHDIRCESILITSKLEPKISNFVNSRRYDQNTTDMSKIKDSILNWMAPEKIKHEKYTVKCEMFSFGMLLWELAFQRKPYRKYDQQQIIEHVLNGGRENFDFGLNSTPVQQKLGNVIKSAWKEDPQDRPEIKKLFNTLNELSKANSVEENSIKLNKREIQEEYEELENPELPNYDIDDILPYEPLLPLKEGYEAHKSRDYQKAWNCFVGHANNGNLNAKYWQGYYLMEGFNNNEIDKEKGIALLKESADAGIHEAQFRYAFALKDRKLFDKNEFVKYLTLAADSDLTNAQYNLGNLYVNGKLGIDKDTEKGLQYLRLAAYNKHEKAVEELNKISMKE